MDWPLHIALICTAASAFYSAFRVRHLEHALRGQGLEIEAVRERAGVTENDIDDYHDRIHPRCAETGDR